MHDHAVTRRSLVLYVICGGLIMGTALGVRHVQGLFMLPMTIDHGWSRETFGFAIALQNLVWGVAQPLTGMIADRYGSGKVICAGTLLYGLGLWLMALAVTPAQLTISAGLLIGVALSGTAFGAIYGALSRIAAPADRGWALGLAGAVGGLGQFVMVPAAQGLLGSIGYAAALVVLGVSIAALTPAGVALRERAGAAADVQRQSLREALAEAFAQRGFWLLGFGFLACGFQLAFIASHLPAYLLDRGLSARDATAGLAIIALTNIAGTYWFGVLGARRRRKYVLATIYLVRAVTMALFVTLPLSPLSVYLFCAVMGFIWLGTVPLTTGLVTQVFGVRYVATLFGFVFFCHQVGSFFGVWLGGVVFDATRSYDLIWGGAIALGVIAAALHWPIDDRELVRAAAGAGAGAGNPAPA